MINSRKMPQPKVDVRVESVNDARDERIISLHCTERAKGMLSTFGKLVQCTETKHLLHVNFRYSVKEVAEYVDGWTSDEYTGDEQE